MNVESSVSRRWPPLVASGVALLLVLVVLPNPLRIPQNNPTATAEYAPVPGKQQDAVGGNFGETGLPTSGGIGSGDTGEGALPGDPIPPPGDPPPRDKQCVGNPPRQAEDPLSPPCVSHFSGDNGGATFQGVTKDEIVVVFSNGLGVEGDMNEPWKPSDESSNHRAQYEQTYLRRTIKALRRYFQTRYQTYGRTVRVIARPSSGSSCAAQQASADADALELKPFATVYLGDNNQCYTEQMAKKWGVLSFGLNFDEKRSNYENFRPYVWGFFPDQETEAQWSASFICNKLRGETAKFSTDPLLRNRERKFGFIRPRNSQRGPSFEEVSDLLVLELKRQCNMEFDEIQDYNASGAGAGGPEAGPTMQRFKANNITTVVCYCLPVPTENTVSTMQNAANSIAYYPEWYWDHASAMDRAIWQQTFSSPTQRGIGVSYLWRAPALPQQYHYQAYLAMEPGTQPNVRFNFNIYHLYLNLFQAIQAAGPILTPETVERGMFTFVNTNRTNPYVPTGGYGPYNSKAVATYNFVDTAMGWWYDPSGTPPGGRRGEGCIRVMRQGLRYYWNDWPEGDSDLVRPDDPCTQDTRKLVDPNSGSI